MPEDLDNADFWLSSYFLAGKSSVSSGGAAGSSGLFGFPSFGSSSLLSSPGESVVGSTETESDEDESVAELTRKLTRSTVQYDLWKIDSGFRHETTKGRVMSTSPQSTLCGCKQNSNRESPNCISPPDVSSGTKSAAAGWDLLYAAAGEVAKMRLAEEERSRIYQNQNRGPISVPLKTSNRNPNLNTNPNLNPNADLHPALAYRQLQAAQFQQMKQQQMMKRQGSMSWNHSKPDGISQYHQTPQTVQNRAAPRPANMAHSGWPAPQQPQRMRAVFLGNGASKRESTGTGVFLPRRVSTPTESRKKQGCSTTVLVPERVAQTLNLNFESMESQPKIQPRCNGSFNTEYDAALKYRNNVLIAQQRLAGVRQPPAISTELRLPQDWTY